MTDRELLEAAAKAAGYDAEWPEWNPLTDDGDAFRLAVKLRIDIGFGPGLICADASGQFDDACTESAEADPYAATRRAIVRAAASIGQSRAPETA